METRTHWTPVGTYAAVNAFLLATALGAAALMHIGEHEAIPWSSLSPQAQHLEVAADGAGLMVALCIAAGLFLGAELFDVGEGIRVPVHAVLAAGATALVMVHAGLAVAHVLETPSDVAHLALLVVGAAAALFLLALAGWRLWRSAGAALPNAVHRGLAIALALVGGGHILIAVSHSAMHGTFW